MSITKKATRSAVKKNVTTKVVGAEIAPVQEEKKDEVLSFKLAIDQKSLDEDGALSDSAMVEFTLTQKEGETLNLNKICGNLSRKIWAIVKQFKKTKKYGFNVRMFVDNTLLAQAHMKTAASISFRNFESMSFGLLELVMSQFDTSSPESIYTGEGQLSAEIQNMLAGLGIKGTALSSFANASLEDTSFILNEKRKDVVRKRREVRKLIVDAVHPVLN